MQIAKLSTITLSDSFRSKVWPVCNVSTPLWFCFLSRCLVLEYIQLTKFNFHWGVPDQIDCFSLLLNSIMSLYFTFFHLVSFLLTIDGLKLASCHQIQKKSNLVTGIFFQDVNTNIVSFIYFFLIFMENLQFVQYLTGFAVFPLFQLICHHGSLPCL